MQKAVPWYGIELSSFSWSWLYQGPLPLLHYQGHLQRKLRKGVGHNYVYKTGERIKFLQIYYIFFSKKTYYRFVASRKNVIITITNPIEVQVLF